MVRLLLPHPHPWHFKEPLPSATLLLILMITSVASIPARVTKTAHADLGSKVLWDSPWQRPAFKGRQCLF